MEPLRLWRVVDQAKFHRMRFICLKPCEFHHTGRCLEETVGADRVVDVLVGDGVALVGFSFGEQPPLQFNLVLAVRWQGVRVSSASAVLTLRSSTEC